MPHGDPEEESLCIDLYLTFNRTEMAVFQMCVDWSQWNPIRDFGQFNIFYEGVDDLIAQIDGLINKSRKQMLDELKKEMAIQRPPVYSKH